MGDGMNRRMTRHPSDLIDMTSAIRTMTDSYVAGGYWDARAVRVRPELHDVDASQRWRLLDDLSDGDERLHALIEDHEYDGELSPELAAVVNDWMVRRAAFAHRVLSGIRVDDDCIVAYRAVGCAPESLRADLGVHWSWDPEWNGGADTHWATEDPHCDVVIMIRARVPIPSVDWQTTMLCAMDYLSGDDERELRLHEGAPVGDVTIEIDDRPASIPTHLQDAYGKHVAFRA